MGRDKADIYALPEKDFGKHKDVPPEYREFAENIAKTIAEKEPPYVISIEGGFGTGKTHFITRFCEYLNDNGIKATYVNAYKDDYKSPIICMKQIIEKLCGEKKLMPLFEKLLKSSQISVGFLKTINYTLNLKDLLENSEKDKVQDFKQSLSEQIKQLESGRLVLIIDELDRCKPDFSINFIEIIKHFFDIDGLVVILSLNYNFFIQSLKSVYGPTFGDDSNGEYYIDKFVNLKLSMCVPKKQEYENIIKTFLEGKISDNLLKEILDRNRIDYLPEIFRRYKLSLRQSKKMCEDIAEYFKNSNINKELFAHLACRKNINEDFDKSIETEEKNEDEYRKKRNEKLNKAVETKPKNEDEYRKKRFERFKLGLKTDAFENDRGVPYFGAILLNYGLNNWVNKDAEYEALRETIINYAKYLYKNRSSAERFAELYFSELFKDIETAISKFEAHLP